MVGIPAGPPIEGEELNARTAALGSIMRCPVCQGLSIVDSPSSNAVAMLAQVRDLLAAGYEDDQILAYFVGSYGEFVLLKPTASGFNLIVWLAPVAMILTGLGLVALRARSSKTAYAEDEEKDDLDEYLEQVRTEAGR